jgi:hypothetical protein
MLDTKDIYWIAGLLEGEGCFSLKTTCNVASIQLCMTDEDVVRKFAALTNSKAYGPYNQGPRRKCSWRVFIAASDAAGLMMTLYKLMGVRRKLAIKQALADWKNIPPTLASISRNRKRFV